MAKQRLSQQLDELIQGMLDNVRVPQPAAAARLAPLLEVARDLGTLPRQDFKARLKDDLERRIRMTTSTETEGTKVKHVAEGYHAVTPYLIVHDAARALEFYKQAFGATELLRLAQPDGRIGHAEIKIGDSPIMLSDEFPDYGHRSPQSLGGSAVTIHLYVEDADAAMSRAVAAGAKVLMPVKDQFYGDRSGKLADPFGHTWIIATHQEDVSAEEMRRRAEAFLKEQARPQDLSNRFGRDSKPSRRISRLSGPLSWSSS